MNTDKGTLKIGKTWIEHAEGQARLCSHIRINGREEVIWYGVNSEQEKYLIRDRSDPFVMLLLPTAMRGSLTMTSEDPMSERLHYQLQDLLMPALCSKGDRYHYVNIFTPLTNEPVSSEGAVVTGFSGGVDSLYTIFTHGKDSLLPVTHLTVFNSGVYEGRNYRRNFQRFSENCRRFADELGLKTIFVDSNVYEALPEEYISVVSYRLLSFALAIQPLASVYLLSSGYQAELFHISSERAAYNDLLTVSCAGTESLRIYLPGAETTRIGKLEAISSWDPSFRWLSSCIWTDSGKKNCGHCKKCMWDLAALYAMGRLENYSPVELKRV